MFENPSDIQPEKINLEQLKPKRETIKKVPIDDHYSENKELLIMLRNLSKTYKTKGGLVEALTDTNLVIYKGDILYIMGPSGSGKTTLLRLISGLELASKGEIFILEENFSKWDDTKRAIFRRDNMGIVAQHGNLNPFLTISENLILKKIYQGNKLTDTIEQNQSILNLFVDLQIKERFQAYPLEISGGELQRASLAIAINESPKILLLDEPTANLDSDLAKHVVNLIFEKCKTLGLTALISTHDLNILKEGVRLIELSDGQIIKNSYIAKA